MSRQSHSKEFKARAVLDPLDSQKTVAEIAAEYEIHPNRVGQWKQDALEGWRRHSYEVRTKRWRALT